jgi:transposase
MAEQGVIARQGKGGLAMLVASLAGPEGEALPAPARVALRLVRARIADADAKILAIPKTIAARQRACAASRRLASIPGIGPITASALMAAVPDASVFQSGRQLAAWLGVVPRQSSTSGKQRQGGITRTGDRHLRRLLVICATGLVRYKRRNVPGGIAWLSGLLAKKPVRLVTVALANKMARIAPPMSPDIGSCGDGSIASCDRWASRGEAYCATPVPAA